MKTIKKYNGLKTALNLTHKFNLYRLNVESYNTRGNREGDSYKDKMKSFPLKIIKTKICKKMGMTKKGDTLIIYIQFESNKISIYRQLMCNRGNRIMWCKKMPLRLYSISRKF